MSFFQIKKKNFAGNSLKHSEIYNIYNKMWNQLAFAKDSTEIKFVMNMIVWNDKYYWNASQF